MKNRLKVIRAEQNLSQDKLAELTGLSRQAINSIENEVSSPSGETIEKLVKATGVSADKIFFGLGVVCKQQEATS